MFRKFYNTQIKSTYRLRDSVFDKSEFDFYVELTKQLPPHYHVFPKMRVADIVEITNGWGYRNTRNNILPRHIDFLITDQYFKPILAIELNGSSHKREDSKKSDAIKLKVFEMVGLPIEFVEVGTNFTSDINNLIDKYLDI